MKNLQEDIKNQDFKKVYLLYGEEKYLLQQYRNKLEKALVPEGDTMNFSLFQGKKTEPREVIELAETMPFFADRRVIFLEDTGFFKNQCQELPEYMAELPDYLCMVFVEDQVDKRSRMYKAVKKYGKYCGIRPAGFQNPYAVDIGNPEKRVEKDHSEGYGVVPGDDRHGYGKYRK